MLTGFRKILIALVCAALLVTGCSFDRGPTGPSTAGDVVEGELSDDGLTLTLDGVVVVTVPPAAAPQGTSVRLAVEAPPDAASRIPDKDGVTSVSETVSVTLGDDLQPDAPISITFPVEDTDVTPFGDGQRALVMRSVSPDGSVSLAAGEFDESAGTFTARAEHLSWFGAFSIDLGAAVEEAKTAVLQGLGLEYPEPDCTEDVAQIDGYTYAARQPPQSWLCVSDQDGTLSVKVSPNSIIPFIVTSDPAASMRTDVNEPSVTSATMVALAKGLGIIGSGEAAVMPSTTATLTFSGTPEEVTMGLQQHAPLLLMTILATTVDTIFGWFRISSTVSEALEGAACMADLAEVAPPGPTLDGETAGTFTRAFFSCAGTLGEDLLSRSAQVILSIVAAAPGFLAGSALGLINEFTGDARAIVELDVSKAAGQSQDVTVDQLQRLGVCGSDCQISGSLSVDHPELGSLTVVTTFVPQPPGAAAVAVIDGNGQVVLSRMDRMYEWALAEPATDDSGNIFIRYDPGRYDGVFILHPTRTGFEAPSGDYLDPSPWNIYSARLIGPGQDGLYEIETSTNDCDPSCAGGTVSIGTLVWDGSRYVPDDVSAPQDGASPAPWPDLTENDGAAAGAGGMEGRAEPWSLQECYDIYGTSPPDWQGAPGTAPLGLWFWPQWCKTLLPDDLQERSLYK